jgi:D-glycero-D-manno-heptose 1,7-bisphosphate phosphatase
MGINPKLKAVFLDRDGVLNRAKIINGKPYPPGSLSELEIFEGVKDGLEQLRDLKYLLIVVTNQPDIARNITSITIVNNINSYLKQFLNLDDIYCCPHDNKDNCLCRKPKPGMVLEAADKWNIDLTKSFIIGDRWSDIETGKNAGLKTIFIDYNYDERKSYPDYTCRDFLEATEIIKSLSS